MPRAKSGLNEKQKKFIKEYLVDLNASQAYIRAGYSEKGAGPSAHQLLKNPKIATRIREAIEARSKRTEITADNVLRELGRIVFSDIKEFVEFDDGQMVLKDSSDLTEDQSHCISEVSDCTYKGERKRSFKLHDKVKAVDMALRHLGMYLDKSQVELSGKVDFATILKKMRDAKSGKKP